MAVSPGTFQLLRGVNSAMRGEFKSAHRCFPLLTDPASGLHFLYVIGWKRYIAIGVSALHGVFIARPVCQYASATVRCLDSPSSSRRGLERKLEPQHPGRSLTCQGWWLKYHGGGWDRPTILAESEHTENCCQRSSFCVLRHQIRHARPYRFWDESDPMFVEPV